MYPEFVAIYIMLAIVIVMLGAVLFLLIKVLRNGTNKASSYASVQQSNDYYAQQYQQPYQQQYQQQYQQPYQPQYQQQAGNVVFCKNCATQFDASQAYCPQCGTRR